MQIALTAHDSKKELMVQFSIASCGILSRHSLCGTAIWTGGICCADRGPNGGSGVWLLSRL